MIELISYSCIKDPVSGLGTPGESFPRYQILLVSRILEADQLEREKAQITQEHENNIRYTPWREIFPTPKFYEKEYNISYEI